MMFNFQMSEIPIYIYENNFLEVMQFVLNHTTFDPKDELDQALLEALNTLGVEPGKSFDKRKVVDIDGKRFRAIAEKVQQSTHLGLFRRSPCR